MTKTDVPTYRFTLSIGFAGAGHEEEVEVPLDEYNPETDDAYILEAIWFEWAGNYIDGGFTLIEDESS